MRMWTASVVAGVLALGQTGHMGALGAPAPEQASIELRASASVKADAPVLLEHVATLQGAEAARLARVQVLSAQQVASGTAGALVIDRARLRTMLESAGVNWARVTLRGQQTSVLVEATGEADADVAPETLPVATAEAAPAQPAPVAAVPAPASTSETAAPGAGTLRALLIDELSRHLQAAREDLRVSTDAQDAPILDKPASGPGGAWLVRMEVLGVGITGRAPVRVEAYEGDRLVLERTFQTVVRQRAGLATAAGTLPKDAVLSEADIRTEERWLPPGQAREASAERLIGQALRRRIDSGKPIGAQDVASPIVARRGQDLWVHCLSGPLVIKTKAKAMSDARDGELVRVQMEGSSKTLTARMSGPGKAVMNIDADDSGSMP